MVQMGPHHLHMLLLIYDDTIDRISDIGRLIGNLQMSHVATQFNNDSHSYSHFRSWNILAIFRLWTIVLRRSVGKLGHCDQDILCGHTITALLPLCYGISMLLLKVLKL